MLKSKECSDCGGRNLYTTKVSAGGGYAPNYLPQLGSPWSAPKFDVVLCQDCGLTRVYAPEEARRKVSAAKKWTRVL
jgi:predicted nucleic-acid-binding Zn-ribbon protein